MAAPRTHARRHDARRAAVAPATRQNQISAAIPPAALPALPDKKTQVASSIVSGQSVALLPAPPTAARPSKVMAAEPGSDRPITIRKSLKVGDSEIYDFDGISTTAVGDPAIADIVPLSTKRLLVNAKGVGTTTIFVFDRKGKNVLRVTVLPAIDSDALATRIEQEIGLAAVTARSVNGTIVLEGLVDSTAAAQRAEAIATAYTPKVKNLLQVAAPVGSSLAETYAQLLTENLSGSGIIVKIIDPHTVALTGKYASPVNPYKVVQKTLNAQTGIFSEHLQEDPLEKLLKSLPPDLKVINLINFTAKAQRQVLVRTKIVDINRDSTKNFGVDWGSLNWSPDGSTFTFVPQPIPFGQVPENAPTSSSLLSGGKIQRLLSWGARLQALVNEGKARILSEPSLTVLDGNDGSILVGGEIPIPFATGTGNNAVIDVVWKQFGIKLDVSPVIVNDDKIQVTVVPEVSELGTGVVINNFAIPGLTVRRATTTLQMASGQTLIIGGLYSNTDSKSVSRIPLLSQVPILGEFFKSTQTKKVERELVIMMECEIVGDDTKGIQPAAPGSLENMNIEKPYVSRKEFNQDFPDVQNLGKNDPEKPRTPVQLPPAPTSDPH